MAAYSKYNSNSSIFSSQKLVPVTNVVVEGTITWGEFFGTFPVFSTAWIFHRFLWVEILKQFKTYANVYRNIQEWLWLIGWLIDYGNVLMEIYKDMDMILIDYGNSSNYLSST